MSITALELKGLSEAQVVEKMGQYFNANMIQSGILASVSFGQFIQESGYGSTELAQNANNCFGMKCNLSGNTWEGSVWDGTSKYTKSTQEQTPDGTAYYITADFRKYNSIDESIADHSAYLLGAKNGNYPRYPGLQNCRDYRKAITIIKNGGYATDVKYIERICNIIERWNLTRFDELPLYRVRKTWEDESSQIGAFYSLDNAKRMAEKHDGYYVFDPSGIMLFPIKYMVKVSIPDLNIREAPSVKSIAVGQTGIGVFTIVDEKIGVVNKNTNQMGTWGLLHAYEKNANGWICLHPYTEKIN